MTQLLNYIPQPNLLLFCDRKGLHAQQPLDLVCLHPLCRNSPLACSVCFDEIHKFHKVISLQKFFDDYSRNSKKLNRNYLTKQIKIAHDETIQITKTLRERINNSIDTFEKHITSYTEYLQNQLNIKIEIAKQFGVELDPKKIKGNINLSDVRKSLIFVLNNSTYDSDSNMVDISQLLQSNNDRILALASKLEYMTLQCQRNFQEAIESLKFAPQTIKQEKITTRINLHNSQYDTIKKFDLANKKTSRIKPPKYHLEYKNLLATSYIEKNSHNFDKTFEIQTQASPDKKNISSPDKKNISFQKLSEGYNSVIINPVTKFRFLTFKHEALLVTDKNYTVKSTINASIPQYILADPHVEHHPYKISTWSLKIIKCRYSSCLNTVAVGLAYKPPLQKSKYQIKPNDFTDGYLVNSQGDVFLPNKTYKDKNFRFSQGDTLHFKYDPFYQLFEISKPNGKQLTLKTIARNDDPLYICVRLTYASDQVQIIN